MNTTKEIFKIVPDDEFVDRERILDLLYTNAIDAQRGASDNIFILGRRRIGKSAVLTRVYDKLFFEQDIVAPFYFTFEGKGKRGFNIAESYFISFVSQYLAFRKKDVMLIKELRDLDLALDMAVELNDVGLASVIRGYLKKHLDKLDLDYALELGNKLAKKYGFELSHEQNIYLATYTDRLPYYIYRILFAVKESKEKIVRKKVLTDTISSETTKRGIYEDLEKQLMECEQQLTEKLYFSILFQSISDRKI